MYSSLAYIIKMIFEGEGFFFFFKDFYFYVKGLNLWTAQLVSYIYKAFSYFEFLNNVKSRQVTLKKEFCHFFSQKQ